MEENNFIGPKGLTPKEALSLVDKSMGEHARDHVAAEMYGTNYGDFIHALGDQCIHEEEADET